MYMKGGDRLYRYLVQSTTTLPLTAGRDPRDSASRKSRASPARWRRSSRRSASRARCPQFFEYLRTDPKFKKPTREALTQGYYAIGKTVDAKLPAYFSTIPKAKLEIRPYEPFRREVRGRRQL